MRALEYIAHHNPDDLLKVDYNGWRPVHEAVYKGDLEALQFLLEHGASIHDRVVREDNLEGPNVLELAKQSPAVSMEHPVMRFLLEEMGASEL